MRVRITSYLTGSVDGMDLSKFLEGLTYDVGTTLGNYLLAQRWAEPSSSREPAAILPLARTVRRPAVLVVEDDADLRQILAQMLEYHGWPVFVAADGLEALSALKTHRPSLILLDLAMPRMDGFQFRTAQRQLRDRRLASVPVVVVSAIDNAQQYKSALHAAAVLVKPFEADRVLEAVESYVRPPNLFR